jgi:translocator protein
MSNIIPLFIAIALAQTAGLIGSVFTGASIETWYETLVKPQWNPPNWVFGPVWFTLYTLMGIASCLVWETPSRERQLALTIYGVHLILNALWSIVFFGLQNPGLAFLNIVVLLMTILITTILFERISPKAGLLMLPYLAWVSFATVLNYTLWQLN